MENKELLWIDEKNLKKEELNLMRATDTLNKFVDLSAQVLGSLDNSQREMVRKERLDYVKAELRKRFSFPNATDEFNYQSLGVNLSPLENLLKGGTPWRQYDFDIDENGTFTASEHQRHFEHYYHYADTPRRKDALQLAKRFEELFAEAQEKGFVDYALLPDVSNALIGIVTIEGEPRRSNSRLVANPTGIALKF